MSDRRDDRLRAGRALARHLGTPEGRELFQQNRVRNSDALLLVLDSDSTREVYQRIVKEVPEPPAALGIYFADSDRLVFMTLSPTRSTKPAESSSEGGGSNSSSSWEEDPHDVHGDTTIGQLHEYMTATKRASLSVVLNKTNGSSAIAAPYRPTKTKQSAPSNDLSSIVGRRFVLTPN
ncbi:MAG TPA: hypothetical protein VGB75_17725 [Jatrophihabitans sp.]|jgi:hypothetical protein|uniref:hypothetical protein n=1 Tax=Jatrophihabitans sp. TaxID=1932789 RepID=UPI002F0516CF